MKALYAVMLFNLLLLSGVCVADTPISMPLKSTFCSPSGRYCATSDAQASNTIVRDHSTSKGGVVWSMKVFVADGFISDDGSVIASCYPGKNLVPSDADLKFIVIKFFDKNGGYKAISLGDIYRSMDELPDTTSHKDWGSCIGFGASGFAVRRADGTVWNANKTLSDEPLK